MNQFKGFDCPSCVWPDPDDKRPIAKYCEKGAKALAEEATVKRIELQLNFKKIRFTIWRN